MNDHRREYWRRYRRENLAGNFEKKLKKLLSLAKDRARKRGIEFSVTAADFAPVTHCPLLGIELSFNNSERGSSANSPSIDRIDPSKGYVPGNVWVISAKANRMKSDATTQELELLVSNMLKCIGNT